MTNSRHRVALDDLMRARRFGLAVLTLIAAALLAAPAESQSSRQVVLGPITIKAQPAAATGCMEFIITSSSTDSIDVTIEYTYNAPDPGPNGLGGYASGLTLAGMGLVPLRREHTNPGPYFNCRKPYEFYFKAKTDNVSQRQRDYEAKQRQDREQKERERQQRELERQQARERSRQQQQQFQDMQRQSERDRLREFARQHPRCIISSQADIDLCLRAERTMEEQARREAAAERERQQQAAYEAEQRRAAQQSQMEMERRSAELSRVGVVSRFDPCRAAEEHVVLRPPPPAIAPGAHPQSVESTMQQYRVMLQQFDLMQRNLEQKCLASRRQRP